MSGIRIAFVGATGMLGKPVAEALQQAGHGVRVVARDVGRAQAALGTRFAYAAADVADTEALVRAFADTDAVYINLSTSPLERESGFHVELDGIRNIVTAARRAGVTRVLYLSSLMQRFEESSWWVLRVKRAAVDLIKNSGLTYTLFYPSNFMENLFYRNKQGSRINLAGAFRHKNYWIAARDYAAQVSESLRLPVANREYVVQGPQALTYPEAAELFARHFSAENLKVSRAPLGVLKIIGLFSRELRYVARILETIGRQPESFEAEATWRDLGTPQTSVADYARSLSG
jgi:uncharacterized protein YbjT (DUF2867 family)